MNSKAHKLGVEETYRMAIRIPLVSGATRDIVFLLWIFNCHYCCCLHFTFMLLQLHIYRYFLLNIKLSYLLTDLTVILVLYQPI